MTSAATKQLIADRVRALAIVHLTRRSDLHIEEAADTGVDLMVRIHKPEDRSLRRFGVCLRGAIAPATPERANELLLPTMRHLAQMEFAYPVCLFYFTMRDNGGLYTWVAQPHATETGEAQLLLHSKAECESLTPTAVDAIVARVDGWYDAFAASVVKPYANRWRHGDGLKVWYSIIDAEADYFTRTGEPPKVLKLPVLLAYDLVKLGREHLGDLVGQIAKSGIHVLEKEGLLGMKVKLVPDGKDITVE
jgi:hypothetical protein